MSKTPLFPGNTLRVMMTENPVFRLTLPSWPQQASPLTPPGPGHGVDSCFLWLNTRLDTICLNHGIPQPHPCIAQPLCLFWLSAAWALANTRGNYPGLYLCSESLTMEKAMFLNKWAFIFLEEASLSSFYSQNNRWRQRKRMTLKGTNQIVMDA